MEPIFGKKILTFRSRIFLMGFAISWNSGYFQDSESLIPILCRLSKWQYPIRSSKLKSVSQPYKADFCKWISSLKARSNFPILETFGLTVNQIPINWTLTIINHWSGIRCFKSVPGLLNWLLLSNLWGSGHETSFPGSVMNYVFTFMLKLSPLSTVRTVTGGIA